MPRSRKNVPARRSSDHLQRGSLFARCSPRVVSLWFHWNGTEIVMCTFGPAPKLKALHSGARVRPEVVVLLDFERRFPSALTTLRLVP
jgi:hypothetical protein